MPGSSEGADEGEGGGLPPAVIVVIVLAALVVAAVLVIKKPWQRCGRGRAGGRPTRLVQQLDDERKGFEMGEAPGFSNIAPARWEEVVDPEDGMTWFVNKDTGARFMADDDGDKE